MEPRQLLQAIREVITGYTNNKMVTLAPELASIVRPGVIWWTGATVVLHEHALDPLLAEAEALRVK